MQRSPQAVRLIGVARRRRASLLVSTALQASVLLVLAVPARAQAPNARPVGGTVSAGSATAQPDQQRYADHTILPARSDRLAGLRCRPPAKRDLRSIRISEIS